MYGNDNQPSQSSTQKITIANKQLQALLSELSDDEEVESTTGPGHENACNPLRPWLQDSHQYLNTHENLGELSVVQWWGINSLHYPVWGAIACDFLSIMATSVSSECAFSSA